MTHPRTDLALRLLDRRRVLLALWLLCLCALSLWTAGRVEVSSDLSQFLPDAVSTDDRVLLAQVREGVAARTLLLSIGGERSGPEIALASRALARELRQDERFERVANGGLDPAGPQGLEALFAHRFLLGPPGPCLDALSESGLKVALVGRLAELRGAVPMLDRERVVADPVGCFRALLQGLAPDDGPARRHGVWFSADGERALLILQSAGDASDLDAQRDAVERVRTRFAALPEARGLGMELAGPGYFAVASAETIRTETMILSLAASLLVAAILWLAFRSARMVLIGALPVATGILVGVALVAALDGFVHGLTLALGITLLGVALDYPVHVFAHVAPNGGPPPKDPGVWRTLLLGVLTTALGYAALALTSFKGLAQLGLLSAAGLATAALCSRFLLPALIPPEYRLPSHPWIANWLARLPVLPGWSGVLALVVSLALLGAVLIRNPDPFEPDLARLSTVPASELARDQAIRHELGAPDVARLLYAVGPDPEAVLTAIESALPDLRGLVEAGRLRDFDAAPLWLPSQRLQLARRDALPEGKDLARALESAGQGLPFRPGTFDPFLKDIEVSRSLPPLRPGDLEKTPIGARLAMLLQPLGRDWIGLVPLSGLAEDGEAELDLRRVAAEHGLRYLDLRVASTRLMGRFLDESAERLLGVLLAIVLVLAIGLRDLGRLVRVLLPIAIALALEVALLLPVLGGLNLFHLVSLILVLGLAIDYSLFRNRSMAGRASVERTVLSLAVCALSTLAMFGLLALSDIPALRAIGSTVALGIVLAIAGALLLAPRSVPGSSTSAD